MNLGMSVAKAEPAAPSVEVRRPIHDLGCAGTYAQARVVDAPGALITDHENQRRTDTSEIRRFPKGRIGSASVAVAAA